MKYNLMKSLSLILFFVFLWGINLAWFVSGGTFLENDAPFRLVVGCLFIFLLPGFIWGEVLGLESKHILETIALAFAITISMEVILLPIGFLFHSTIKLWITLLFIVSFLGILILLLKLKNTKETKFLTPILNIFQEPSPLNITTPLFILFLIIISYGTYRWGENVTDIDGEKLLHLSFVRYYFSLPMSLQDMTLIAGAIPQNLIHLWEYLIAGWSYLINVDPLVVFYRARFVIPVLGFSGMYLLVANIFQSRAKVEAVIWGVMVMCLGWFALLSPSNLDWIKQDPFRGIMSFMGTVHHADTAMEILIPLSCGLMLMAFRRPEWKTFCLVGGVLIASLLWHVREFFQVAIYLGISGIIIFIIPDVDRKKIFIRWGGIVAVFLIIALSFLVVNYLIVPQQSNMYDEFKLKEIALSYAMQNLFDFRTIFNFPIDLRLTQGLDKTALVTNMQIAYLFANSWNFFLWLIVSAAAVLLLVIKGTKEDKHLSLFYLISWFFILCWGFSQMMLIVFTYSEINFTAPRMIYLFSYIIIASAFCTAYQWFDRSDWKHIIPSFVMLFIMGLAIRLWWGPDLLLSRVVSVIFSIAFIVSFFLLIYPKTPKLDSMKFTYPGTAIVGIIAFFMPILAMDYAAVVPKIVTGNRPAVDWFGKNNPFRFSPDLIQALKALPSKQIFMMNPLGKAPISIYVPQRYAVVPEFMGITLVGSRSEYNDFRQGKHPIFKEDTTPQNPNFITKKPDFMDSFSQWKGPESVVNNIAKASPPMVLRSYKGDFVFTRKSATGGNVIHVSPSQKTSSDNMSLSFGYDLNDNGFLLNFQPGEEVAFAIDVRLSKKTKVPAQIVISDVARGTANLSSTSVNDTLWKTYLVKKRIRDGAKGLSFGISWIPENSNSWMEIKNVRIYVADSISNYYKAPEADKVSINVDHAAAKAWLDKNHVNYLLIEKNFYGQLFPYFSRFPREYKIIYNNHQSKELIVQYQQKSSS